MLPSGLLEKLFWVSCTYRSSVAGAFVIRDVFFLLGNLYNVSEKCKDLLKN